MRKFTLFFMSMFLMVGTIVAQDALQLTSVRPNDATPVLKVDYIELAFNKEVNVTIPEGGIAVTNTTTNEVIKLTRLNEDAPKSYAILLFEQIEMRDEKGSPYMMEQRIEAPGTYSFTIPAGCIKSVDNEEFAEQTFTFTVVEPFSLTNYSPAEVNDTLKEIVLTFEKEIVDVNMPNRGFYVTDLYGSQFFYIKKDVTISEDKKTVTLELEDTITTPGQYFLDLYEGVFVSADGLNANASLSFTIIDTKPSFSTSYQDGDRVKEISNVLEITFKNVTEVKPAEGENAPKITVYPPSGAEIVGTATCENNKITVTFDGMPTKLESGKTEGDFLFFIPAGAFTMDGVANESREINVTLYTVDITPLQVEAVYPEVGTVEQLDRIVIKFNQPVGLSWTEDYTMQISREIKLTCGDQEYTLTNDAGYSSGVSSELTYLVNAEWDGYQYASTPITAEGTYTLNLADIVVDYAPEMVSDGNFTYVGTWHGKNGSCEGTYTWTIGAGEGIKATEAADGEQAIYDLLGRRVEKITGAGIYIVNGKKLVVK